MILFGILFPPEVAARYLLTYSLAHLLTCSLAHLLTYSLTRLLTWPPAAAPDLCLERLAAARARQRDALVAQW